VTAAGCAGAALGGFVLMPWVVIVCLCFFPVRCGFAGVGQAAGAPDDGDI